MAHLGKCRHEALEYGTELLRVEATEQSAERIVAGQTALKPQEAAQERLLGLGIQCHVDRRLPATQDRAKGNDQQLVEVVPAGIAGTGVGQIGEAGNEAFQCGLLGMANPQG